MQLPEVSGAQRFNPKKVSVTMAVKILKKNDIKVNEDQAQEILDFLYLIAKTYNPTKD